MNRNTFISPDSFTTPQPPQNISRDTVLGVSQPEQVVTVSDYSPVDGVVMERYSAPVESFTPRLKSGVVNVIKRGEANSVGPLADMEMEPGESEGGVNELEDYKRGQIETLARGYGASPATVDRICGQLSKDEETVGMDQPNLRQGVGVPGYGYETPPAKPIRRSCI